MNKRQSWSGVIGLAKWFLPFYLFTLLPFSSLAQKREMRGAWIQCVNG
jgi:hypothetical protein